MKSAIAESVAYHEAGHAVAYWAVTLKAPQLATILPEEGNKGHVKHNRFFSTADLEFDASPRLQRKAENAIIVCLAGPLAQRRHNPRSMRKWHGSSDYEEAVEIANKVCGSAPSAEAFLKWLEVRTNDIVAFRWPSIERVASSLLIHRTLTTAQLLSSIMPQRAAA